MSPTFTNLRTETQAAILERVLHMKHSYELGSIASGFHLTLAELQKFLATQGYPDKDRMRTARAALLEPDPHTRAATTADQETAGDTETGTLAQVRVGRLVSDPNNPRDNLTDIPDLARSILEIGLLQPIVARTHGTQLIVVAGHRRLAAVRQLGWETVDTIIRPSMRSDQILAAMLIENNQRADLDPIEEARGLMRLKTERDCTDLELAGMIGRSGPFISGRLALLSLTPEQQDEVRAGNMSLMEASHRGRQNSGKVGKKGVDRNWHLGPQHELANRAKARCRDLGHSRGRTVGGMACGECWETVIRSDERVQLVARSVRKGQCDTCGGLVQPASEGSAG